MLVEGYEIEDYLSTITKETASELLEYLGIRGSRSDFESSPLPIERLVKVALDEFRMISSVNQLLLTRLKSYTNNIYKTDSLGDRKVFHIALSSVSRAFSTQMINADYSQMLFNMQHKDFDVVNKVLKASTTKSYKEDLIDEALHSPTIPATQTNLSWYLEEIETKAIPTDSQSAFRKGCATMYWVLASISKPTSLNVTEPSKYEVMIQLDEYNESRKDAWISESKMRRH